MAIYHLTHNNVVLARLQSDAPIQSGEEFYLAGYAYAVSGVVRRVNPGVPGDIEPSEFFEVTLQAV